MSISRWLGRFGKIVAILALCCFAAGCSADGTRRADQPQAVSEAGEEKVRIGISFDSFVIERWLRDRDVFVATAQGLGAEVNVQNANGEVKEQIEQIDYLIEKGMDVIVIIAIVVGALSK